MANSNSKIINLAIFSPQWFSCSFLTLSLFLIFIFISNCIRTKWEVEFVLSFGQVVVVFKIAFFQVLPR